MARLPKTDLLPREAVEETRRRNAEALKNRQPLREKDKALIESVQAKRRGEKPH
jgi:hypothetical protein